MEPELLAKLDRMVKDKTYRSRSQAVQVAVREKVERLEHTRLGRECKKLDRKLEQAMAEEGMSEELGQWPEY